jgi:hypothetical protein
LSQVIFAWVKFKIAVGGRNLSRLFFFPAFTFQVIASTFIDNSSCIEKRFPRPEHSELLSTAVIEKTKSVSWKKKHPTQPEVAFSIQQP